MAKDGWLTSEQRLARHIARREDRERKRKEREQQHIAKMVARGKRSVQVAKNKCGAPVSVFFTFDELHDVGAALYHAQTRAAPAEFIRGAVLALIADATGGQGETVRHWIEKARKSREAVK